MTDVPGLADFPLRARDKLRYRDTDRQGHVNNAVYASLLETARVELIYDRDHHLVEPGASFVIARLEVDFRSELFWPGEVVIGSRISEIGRSSVRLAQAIFQDDRCAATAMSIIVQVDEQSRRARPFSDAVRQRFAELARNAPA